MEGALLIFDIMVLSVFSIRSAQRLASHLSSVEIFK
jgi:hypothetical protein